MFSKILIAFLAGALVSASGAARLVDASQFSGPHMLPVDEVISEFRRVCVATLPNRASFAAAVSAKNVGWQRIAKPKSNVLTLDTRWQSRFGELSYVDAPDLPFSIPNPACHLTFRTEVGFDHDATAALLARALGMSGGKAGGKKRESQQKWEERLTDGRLVRVFLSAGRKLAGGPASTLSISRMRSGGRAR